jgi:hypothetical protein
MKKGPWFAANHGPFLFALYKEGGGAVRAVRLSPVGVIV